MKRHYSNGERAFIRKMILTGYRVDVIAPAIDRSAASIRREAPVLTTRSERRAAIDATYHVRARLARRLSNMVRGGEDGRIAFLFARGFGLDQIAWALNVSLSRVRRVYSNDSELCAARAKNKQEQKARQIRKCREMFYNIPSAELSEIAAVGTSHAVTMRGPAKSTSVDSITQIAHPGWSPAMDLEVLKTAGAGVALSALASRLGRPSSSLMQRYHRIRTIAGLGDQLRQLPNKKEPYRLEGVA